MRDAAGGVPSVLPRPGRGVDESQGRTLAAVLVDGAVPHGHAGPGGACDVEVFEPHSRVSVDTYPETSRGLHHGEVGSVARVGRGFVRRIDRTDIHSETRDRDRVAEWVRDRQVERDRYAGWDGAR